MADKFNIRIITPERIFYEGGARMIEFTTTEGEIGVYPGHIPLTAALAPGIVSITLEDESKKLAGIYKGFAEILPNKVTILAEDAEWPEEIDVSRAEQAEKKARERLAKQPKDLDLIRCEVALKKAIIRQRLVK